jgi:hypothetical protein
VLLELVVELQAQQQQVLAVESEQQVLQLVLQRVQVLLHRRQ